MITGENHEITWRVAFIFQVIDIYLQNLSKVRSTLNNCFTLLFFASDSNQTASNEATGLRIYKCQAQMEKPLNTAKKWPDRDQEPFQDRTRP